MSPIFLQIFHIKHNISTKQFPNLSFFSSHLHNLTGYLNSSTIFFAFWHDIWDYLDDIGYIGILNAGYVFWCHGNGMWCIMGEMHSRITTKIALESASSVRSVLVAPLVNFHKAGAVHLPLGKRFQVEKTDCKQRQLIKWERALFKWICVVHDIDLYSYSCVCFDETDN